MKKLAILATMALMLGRAGSAFAIDGGTPRQPLTTVADVLAHPVQDYPVVITGTIARNVGGDKYAFVDSSGSIGADIDREELYNLHVEGARVTVSGTVNTAPDAVEIHVDHVESAE